MSILLNEYIQDQVNDSLTVDDEQAYVATFGESVAPRAEITEPTDEELADHFRGLGYMIDYASDDERGEEWYLGVCPYCDDKQVDIYDFGLHLENHEIIRKRGVSLFI